MLNDLSTLELNENQKIVWQHERAYWEALKNADLNSLLKLIHKEIIIWPSWSKRSMNKLDFEQHLKQNLQAQEALVELKAESLLLIGDTAIIYYLAKQSDKEKADKITHVWLFEKDKWLMVGGTSSNKD
ncbi:MAG: nuclear transport factor 2 family protein [Tatlockia sp.]|nr:nuclear transport factor 2 family protein [Tatlockia sp.]